MDIRNEGHSKEKQTKSYKFLLLMPLNLMEGSLNKMTQNVKNSIIFSFTIPYVLLSGCMSFVIAVFLRDASVYLTEPIIDLYVQIGGIMSAQARGKKK